MDALLKKIAVRFPSLNSYSAGDEGEQWLAQLENNRGEISRRWEPIPRETNTDHVVPQDTGTLQKRVDLRLQIRKRYQTRISTRSALQASRVITNSKPFSFDNKPFISHQNQISSWVSKVLMVQYILRKISNFQSIIAQRLSGISGSNFQR